jgi:hypothetical protein
MEDEHRRMDGVVLGDVTVENVSGGAGSRFGEILQRVDLSHKRFILK